MSTHTLLLALFHKLYKLNFPAPDKAYLKTVYQRMIIQLGNNYRKVLGTDKNNEVIKTEIMHA